ncbi:MAG TPA: dipeptide epimerase, partial [Pirellulaceae bacterium]
MTVACELILHAFDLRLRHTFRISREAHDVQPTLIAELRKDGVAGFGEATSNPYYGVSVHDIAEALQAARPQIESATWTTPEELWEFT